MNLTHRESERALPVSEQPGLDSHTPRQINTLPNIIGAKASCRLYYMGQDCCVAEIQ